LAGRAPRPRRAALGGRSRFAIVAARFHEPITKRLLDGALDAVADGHEADAAARTRLVVVEDRFAEVSIGALLIRAHRRHQDAVLQLEGPDAPGLLVLSDDGEVESATPGVERWLRALPDGDWDAGRLPSAVLAVAGRALRTAEHPDEPGQVAVSRVLSRAGTWVVLHGASLVSGGAHRVAVIVEPAHPARIAPLLMSVYGLTDREQEVTRLVLQGNSTTEIAERLVVSAHTVQQHLKSVFDKTGVRSRRDLVGKVFFAHYEPRLRDNEHRAIGDRPLRGGPLDSHAARGR